MESVPQNRLMDRPSLQRHKAGEQAERTKPHTPARTLQFSGRFSFLFPLMILLPVTLLLLGTVADAHTIRVRLLRVRFIEDSFKEPGKQEYKFHFDVDFGTCDRGEPQVSRRFPPDLDQVYRVEPSLIAAVGECFKVIPHANPWPIVKVQIAVTEVDDLSFDTDAKKRHQNDTNVGDYAEFRGDHQNIPCPAAGKSTFAERTFFLRDLNNGTRQGTAILEYEIHCID